MSETCNTCALWRRRVRPAKGEATEYLGHRPCGDGTRRGFFGGQVQKATGSRVLTAPNAGCANHLPLSRGEEQ